MSCILIGILYTYRIIRAVHIHHFYSYRLLYTLYSIIPTILHSLLYCLLPYIHYSTHHYTLLYTLYYPLYIEGRIPVIPWCEASLQKETAPLTGPLAAMNRYTSTSASVYTTLLYTTASTTTATLYHCVCFHLYCSTTITTARHYASPCYNCILLLSLVLYYTACILTPYTTAVYTCIYTSLLSMLVYYVYW